ncbi:hypothetical protein CEE44_04245 [Candidatus Woesearchaeota archaeon B3_Woes]|nr:MAG: hypothetical protein CEE44_04245 [Candidatus Woesearchaeota archaeon B3_Woes]
MRGKMLIKSVKLDNIRSYTNQSIEFPEKSVLLSGDIGSGKSTVLSAIEFALFGLKRKDLSGSVLLRHGRKQGSVELNFMIDNKDVIIKRNLKRGKDDVKQDTGYIIVDGVKKEATAVELKTQILELLGYPSDLVSKSKDLIYRYTVYTPQEQMKQILASDVESRLDTLRRVFGIEKYKRIRENTLIISKGLKEKINVFQGQIEDLDEKQDGRKQRKQEIREIDEKIKELLPSLDDANEKLKLKKSEIESIEKNIKDLNSLKEKLSVNEVNLNNNQDQLKRNKEEIIKTEEEIKKTKEEVKDKQVLDVEILKKDITKRQENISVIENRLDGIKKDIVSLEVEKQTSDKLKEKINKISECPTCLQEVSNDHKMFISGREDENVIYIEQKIKNNNSKKDELEKEISMLKEGLEKIRKKESEISLIKLKLVHAEEKTKTVERLKKDNENIEKGLLEVQNDIKDLKGKVEGLKDNEESYNIIKKEYDELNRVEMDIKLKKEKLTSEKETMSNFLLSLEEEINKKLEVKDRMKNLKEKHNWLNKHFVNLVTTIEKHVMIIIHQEFNELFKDWFNLLIEDEILNARLDDSFTPLIDQDGHDVDFNSLSGGERTSLALAYRLGLNKVINDLITNIKMKDLIILDEPTDGFSTEQLDRVRDVIDQLNLNQTIIVSHESKIEGFVDNIIRVVKEDQVSKIIDN